MSYLITCSGSKKLPFELNPSNLNNLTFNELNPIRNLLINEYQIQKNLVLDWNMCLPAWQLYSGNRAKLYPRIENIKWLNQANDVKILSALFGWINHTDLIPWYNLKMNERININGVNILVYKYWLNNINLNEYTNLNDIDLLSKNYRKAINLNGTAVAQEPIVVWNDNYGVHKGRWLNNELQGNM